MSDPNLPKWPDLLVIKEFLDLATCGEIVAEMNTAESDAATVYGRTTSGSVDQSVRRTLRIRPSAASVALVIERLLGCKEAVEEHFDLTLTECEDPQFLRYRRGDFFVAHQDGNTGMLRLETERRLISTVIFLSRESDSPQPDAHCGGSLLFTDLRAGPRVPKVHMRGEPGTLIAFRAETTHEVTPVTRGERYSIVSWYR